MHVVRDHGRDADCPPTRATRSYRPPQATLPDGIEPPKNASAVAPDNVTLHCAFCDFRTAQGEQVPEIKTTRHPLGALPLSYDWPGPVGGIRTHNLPLPMRRIPHLRTRYKIKTSEIMSGVTA